MRAASFIAALLSVGLLFQPAAYAQSTQARAQAEMLRATPSQLAAAGLPVNQDGAARSVIDLLALPGVDMARLTNIWLELRTIAPEIAEQLEIDARYRGYLDRQDADIRAFRQDETLELPTQLDYASIASLSTEVRQKLAAVRPATLGQAARISGVTPAALTVLLKYVRRREAA